MGVGCGEGVGVGVGTGVLSSWEHEAAVEKTKMEAETRRRRVERCTRILP